MDWNGCGCGYKTPPRRFFAKKKGGAVNFLTVGVHSDLPCNKGTVYNPTQG